MSGGGKPKAVYARQPGQLGYHCVGIGWNLLATFDGEEGPERVRETFIKQAQNKRKSGDRERAAGSLKKTADTNAGQAQGSLRPRLEPTGPFVLRSGAGEQLPGHGDPFFMTA